MCLVKINDQSYRQSIIRDTQQREKRQCSRAVRLVIIGRTKYGRLFDHVCPEYTYIQQSCKNDLKRGQNKFCPIKKGLDMLYSDHPSLWFTNHEKLSEICREKLGN